MSYILSACLRTTVKRRIVDVAFSCMCHRNRIELHTIPATAEPNEMVKEAQERLTGDSLSTGMRPLKASTAFGVNSSFCTVCPKRP